MKEETKELDKVGVLFDYPKGMDRRELLEYMVKVVVKGVKAEDGVLMAISLHDGEHRVTYETVDDVPLEDVPCPCGDANHWIIKWSEHDEARNR